MIDKFCPQCGKPLAEPDKRDVKASWGLSWGLMWKQGLIGLIAYIPLCILLYLFFLLAA